MIGFRRDAAAGIELAADWPTGAGDVGRGRRRLAPHGFTRRCEVMTGRVRRADLLLREHRRTAARGVVVLVHRELRRTHAPYGRTTSALRAFAVVDELFVVVHVPVRPSLVGAEILVVVVHV